MSNSAVKPLNQDDPCYEDRNCKDETCQDKILDRHDLKTQVVFEAMVLAFKNPMLDSKEYSADSIEKLMEQLDCKAGHHIKFTADENDDKSNQDIKLEPVAHPLDGKYSIAFFRGVIRKYGSGDSQKDTFHFYKARQADKKPTLVVKFNAHNKGDQYFADLVGLYP